MTLLGLVASFLPNICASQLDCVVFMSYIGKFILHSNKCLLACKH